MGIFSGSGIADILLRLPAVLWAISFHEFCHGWAASKLGDRSAQYDGRLSLNPLAHLDIVGTLMLVLVGFGWARPVPINSRNFRHPRRDIAIVSLAGALGNFATALFFGVLFRAFPSLLGYGALSAVLVNMLHMNIGLGVFNLIPIPPLDGSKVLAVFLPPSALRTWFFLERWGMLIILALLVTGILEAIMIPIIRIVLNIVLLQFI